MPSGLKRYRVVVHAGTGDEIFEDIFARSVRSAESKARDLARVGTSCPCTTTKLLDKPEKALNARVKRAMSPPAETSRLLAPPARIVSIGPEEALAILEAKDPNRNVTQTRVMKYAADMAAGRWTMNGETIKYGKNGELLDGQHRLWAVVESGCTIDFLVVEGLDPSVMDTIDTGKARTFGDVLSIAQYKNSTTLAAAARVLWWYEQDNPGILTGATPSHPALQEVIKEHPKLGEAAGIAQSKGKARKFVSNGPLAFVIYVMDQIDPEKAHEWLEALATGANLSTDHPVFLLRDRLGIVRKGTRKDPSFVISLCIRSWNLLVTGKRRNSLIPWREGDPYPQFTNAQGRVHKVRAE